MSRQYKIDEHDWIDVVMGWAAVIGSLGVVAAPVIYLAVR